MVENNSMREELLKQTDQNPTNIGRDNKKSIERIFARDAARVKRMKWITIFSWLMLAIVFVIGAIFESNLRVLDKNSANIRWGILVVLILRTLFVTAVIFTISFYVRMRTLSIKQIQHRLSEIEKLLQERSKNE